jgi:hypothetical protein
MAICTAFLVARRPAYPCRNTAICKTKYLYVCICIHMYLRRIALSPRSPSRSVDPGLVTLKDPRRRRVTCSRPAAMSRTADHRIERAGHLDGPWPAHFYVHAVQARVDNDTPSFVAMADVAPGVRLSAFAIFLTPALAFAIVFICRTSSLVHVRRTIFLALAIFAPFLVERPCITRDDNRNDYLLRGRQVDTLFPKITAISEQRVDLCSRNIAAPGSWTEV